MDTSRFAEFSLARRFRVVNRIAQIVLSLSLILSLNFLAAKYFERYDLTEAGTYTLAAETRAYIRELAEPVDIVVTIPDSPETELVLKDLQKLLRQYEAEDAKDGTALLNVEFVDIYKQRARAQQLASRYKLTKENVVLVASGDKSQEINPAKLYEVTDGETTGFIGERIITSAILNVSAEDTDKIYFLLGHGEMRLDDVDPRFGLSQVESFLKERNFELANLDLSIDPNVPEDADLIIIPSPQAALLPEEVEKLRRYLGERNGRMLVLINPGRAHGLDELLYDWGVLSDDMTVIDVGSDFKAQGGDLIIRRFAEHPITQLLIDNQINALFGLPRPVRTDPASLNMEGLKVEQILGTSAQSWGERDYRTQNPVKYDSGRDLPGPLSIATVSTRSAGSELGITIQGGRLIVFGNSDFVANNRFQAFGNQSLFINSINWALDRNNMLNIPSRPLQNYQIIMSEQELKRLILYFAIVPGITALFGFAVHLLRRR